MTPHYTDDAVTLYHGDCIEIMASLPDASVDAVVTDPPYELGFMGRRWDSTGVAYRVDLWQQALRVLKPGGHLLAFGGTRTWHRLAVAVEDAGFEVRDSLAWLYASGFPKSLDVSKAIDKAAGAEREVVSVERNYGASKAEDGKQAYGDYAGEWSVTAPATPDATRWQGWGTALKPAFEPIVVARKPLIGTVAANVLEHGTGALNVDGCRIEGESTVRTNRAEMGYHGGNLADQYTTGSPAGRWPANVILDGYREPVLRLRDNLPVEVERTIREAFGASTDHLPAVRDHSERPPEQGDPSEVLLPPVPGGVDVGEPRRGDGASLGQDAHSRDAKEDRGQQAVEPHDGREGRQLEGREVSKPGVRLRQTDVDPRSGAAVVRVDGDSEQGRLGHLDSVHTGTQARDGAGDGPGAHQRRARPPHQRDQVGQPSRESGSDEQLGAPPEALGDRSGVVPAARGERGATGSTLEVLRRECPPRWRDYFRVVRECESQAGELDGQSRDTDTGGASRFFKVVEDNLDDLPSRFKYEPKAPTSERPRVDGVAHPTVKSLSLMRWLVRLVTPPGGVVLEPFAGSGTTAEACVVEGFRCIAIEREADYLPLIVSRLSKPIEVTLL